MPRRFSLRLVPPQMKPSSDFSTLVEIMAALRDPVSGCPWDLEQDFKSISHYTIEESYEVADAIERQDFEDLCSELGDLLLQPVYHAQMAAEAKLFDLDDVILAITGKMIRRHPHVFGQQASLSVEATSRQWDQIKAGERSERAARRGRGQEEQQPPSLLDDVAKALPALRRAEKLSEKAAKAGFDWPDMDAVLAKCDEELAEVKQAWQTGLNAGPSDRVREEIGDLLFALANLARQAGVSPEAALSEANAKFTRRFRYVEQRCHEENIKPERAGPKRLDRYWNEIRAADKRNDTP